MNIAFLFNADHPSMNGSYGFYILKQILATDVLQNSMRNMKVKVGDILTFSAATQSATPTYEYLDKLNKAVYLPKTFNKLLYKKLETTYKQATVYCWLFQNMTDKTANILHDKLKQNNEIYLGAMDVNYSNPLHLYFFRNSLIEMYRLHNGICSIFYSMGENEDPDTSLVDTFQKYNFEVKFEDSGARNTIFDNYDTLEHFKRIDDFKNTFSKMNTLSNDIIDDILLLLEELHPKVFDILASASRTFNRIETDEDIAQCALSGRRILENLANYLYPPSNIKYKGRKVGKAEYKNRLWAYVESTIDENELSKDQLLVLGKQVDNLIDTFNKGLHSNLSTEEIQTAFTNLMLLIKNIIELSLISARKPYLAYEDELDKFHEEMVSRYL